MRFISKEKHESGLGESGEVMGYWHLVFHERHITWDYSDVRERPTYRVDPNGTIRASTYGGGRRYEGRFYPKRKQLLWNGVWYQQED